MLTVWIRNSQQVQHTPEIQHKLKMKTIKKQNTQKVILEGSELQRYQHLREIKMLQEEKNTYK